MSEQVKFLSGLKDQLDARAKLGGLKPGALYFCTDEKKIFRAITNNRCEAVNEEVYFGALPDDVTKAFPGKLYLRQSDMTLHVLNEAKDGFKQLSTPANALLSDDISEKLNEEDGKKLVSKKAVKGAVDSLALADAEVLSNAEKYADTLAGHYSGEVDKDNQPIQPGGLRKEIEDRIAAEKTRAESVESGFSGRLDKIEGTGDGSITKAVADEAATRLTKDNELAQDIADEATARTEADSLLEARIDTLAGNADTPGSVAAQIKGVQDQVDSIKNIVGHEAVPGGEGKDPQPAEGLFAKIDEEKTRAETAEKVLTDNLAAEVTRATAADEANATAIAAEKTRAEAAEKANADAIAVLNGADTVEGSVKKQIKDAVGAEATLRLKKDNELQGAIDNINDALGLGGATGSASISSRLDSVEDRADALEAIVGHETIPGGDGQEEQPATGLVKDVADLKAKDVELAAKDTSLQASIDTLNGGVEVAGSVAKAVADEAKLRKDADDALDGRLDHLESVVEDENSGLVKKVADNAAAIATINDKDNGILAKANKYTDTAVANLVNSAPEALDTLQELANALGDDPNFATTVATQIGEKADKTYVDEKLDEIKTGEGSIGARLTAVEEKNTKQDEAIANVQKQADKGVADAAAEATRAQKAELELKNSIDAINNETTGILAKAKAYADQKDGKLHTAITDEINTAVEAEANRAKGIEAKLREDVDKKVAKTDYDAKVLELEQADADNLEAAKTDAKAKDDALRIELQGYANSAVKAEEDRAVAAEGELETAVNSKVDQSAYDTKIAALEKADTDNLATAKSYTDEKVGDLNGLATDAKGSAVLAINELKGAVNKINTDLGLEGATGTTASIKDRLNSLESVVGNAEGGLVKDVDENTTAIAKNAGDIAKNTTNISNNAAAIEIINGDENQAGSIAKALKDAKAYTDKKIGVPSVPGKDSVPGTPATGLHKVIEDGDADTLADAKTYTDKTVADAVGKASEPGEAEAPGKPATGLHKVIEDGDTTTLESAKNYADTTVTEALTWGSF